MSIRQTPGADGGTTTVATGHGVDVFRLLAVRGMLRLEMAGMTGKGGALRPKLAKQFGLSPRDPHQAYIDYCTNLIEVGKKLVAAEIVAEDAIAKARATAKEAK